MSLMSKSGLWLPTPAHTPRSSPLLHSPTHPTPTHGMWLYVRAHSVHLLVTVVHLFDPLLSLHDQSIRHGTHGGGLASRATMTTNTFGSGSWASVGAYRGWGGNTPSTRLEHGSLTQTPRAHDLKLTPIEPIRHVPTLPHHHLMTCHRSWWLFSNHCGFHTGRVGGCPWRMVPRQLSQAPVTLHAVQER